MRLVLPLQFARCRDCIGRDGELTTHTKPSKIQWQGPQDRRSGSGFTRFQLAIKIPHLHKEASGQRLLLSTAELGYKSSLAATVVALLVAAPLLLPLPGLHCSALADWSLWNSHIINGIRIFMALPLPAWPRRAEFRW
jgi:hypothetical protein